MDIERQVRDYIVEAGRWHGAPADLTDDYRLIEEDVLDSMEIYSLVGFLEDTYDIVVDIEELVTENLATISSIARMVHRLRAS